MISDLFVVRAGMSARIAQALGLFADCTPLLRAGRLRPRQVFDRTWCYHMAAAQDACWSLYVGREFGIPLPPATTPTKQSSGGSNQMDKSSSGNMASSSSVDMNNPEFSMDNPFCVAMVSSGGVGESLDRMTWRIRGKADEGNDVSVPQCKTFTTFLWGCQLMKIGRSVMDLMWVILSHILETGSEITIT